MSWPQHAKASASKASRKRALDIATPISETDDEGMTGSMATGSSRPHDRSAINKRTHHKDVVARLVERERSQMPDPTYLTTKQRALAPKMISILYEWLADVCLEDSLRFQRRTLDAAIRNVDRLLSVQTISTSHLQLVGAASLLIAYKFNETTQGSTVDDTTVIEEIVNFGCDAFTKIELFAMERMMVEALQWRLRPITAMEILEVIVDAEHKSVPMCKCDHQTNIHCNYLLGPHNYCQCNLPMLYAKTDKATWNTMSNLLYLTQCNYEMLGFSPSIQAAAAYAHARHLHLESSTAFNCAIEYAAALTEQAPMRILNCAKAMEAISQKERTRDKTRSITPPSVDAASDFLRS